MTYNRFRERSRPMSGDLLGTMFGYHPTYKYWYVTTKYYVTSSDRKRVWVEHMQDQLNPGPPYRQTGLLSKGEFVDGGMVPVSGSTYFSNTGLAKYEGAFLCLTKPLAAVGYTHDDTSMNDLIDDGDATSYGAEGWNRFAPGSPTASIGVSLGESRDLPRMLRQTAKTFLDLWKGHYGRKSTSRQLSGDWLNAQFGWLPFVSDVRKFYRTYKRLESKLEHIKRYNNVWRKVGGTVQSDLSTDMLAEYEYGIAYPTLSSGWWSTSYPNPCRSSIARTTSDKVWFSARSRYYIPDIGTVKWRRKAIAKLFGAYPTPEVLWELVPWSWLVDWFSNAGDVLANMSTGWAENLVMKNACIMRRREISTDVYTSCPTVRNGTIACAWRYSAESKHRAAASPFGFSLTPELFSARQWSILAALGITRSNL